MASLPDINLDNVGHIAWWNALDHDASFLDPDDLTAYSGIADYEIYQNGIVGTLERDNRLRFRAKTDGWIVVYYDVTVSGRPEDYAFVPDFLQGAVDIYENVLAQELNSLRENAANSSKMVFSYEDVGFGDYRDDAPARYESYQYDPGVVARYAYTEENEPDSVHLTGRSEMTVNGATITAIIFNERELVPEQQDQGVSSGYEEAVSAGWMNDDAEVHYMTGGEVGEPSYADIQAGALMTYS